ncbi:hypothetical protein G6F70_004413 [Rhizopus microsporus]|nr:hypothetical protein G6F71_004489 [Rhizopus microsporus]KAG1200025.1 hypothetical protein G6F70_004413 [Rhizopus microsporus]KAG1211486.1 hypothetical protein G6F69_004564 [Rhizopus microsporus]KAG1233809.1 hypothetical protein G6F67_004016 [Rhizopus microsporus]KAG1259647.1 hypothetical protein G6F68_007970 [Rhizopus microsporus]
MEKQYEPKEDSVTLGNMSSMTRNVEQTEKTSELTTKEAATATVNELIVTTIPANQKERKTMKPDTLPNKATERVYHFRQAIIAEDKSNHQPTDKQDIRQPDERRKKSAAVDDKEHTHRTKNKDNKYDDDKEHTYHTEDKDNKYDGDKDDNKDDKDDKGGKDDNDDDDDDEDDHKDSDDDDNDDGLDGIHDKIMPAIATNTISKFTMTSVDPIVTSFLVGYGAAAGHAEDEIGGLGLVGMVQASAGFSSDAYDVDTLINYFILHDPRTFRNHSNLGYCLHV